jgi:hypothetical protein
LPNRLGKSAKGAIRASETLATIIRLIERRVTPHAAKWSLNGQVAPLNRIQPRRLNLHLKISGMKSFGKVYRFEFVAD